MARLVDLVEIYSGAHTTLANRWSAVGFFDKILFAAPDNVTVFFRASQTTAQPIPGLPAGERYDGVSAFFDHIILWRGAVLKWSDVADFSMFIPVGATAVSLRLTLFEQFIQPELGIESEWVYVDESIAGLVAGVFLQISDDPTFNYYSVTEVAPIGGVTGNTPVGLNQFVTVADQKLFTTEWRDWKVDSHIGFAGDKKPLQVVSKSLNESFSAATAANFTVPVVGDTVVVSLSSTPFWTENQLVSINQTEALSGSDIYEVLSKDTGASTVTLKRLGMGSDQNSTGGAYGTGATIISQHWVSVTPVRDSDIPIFVDDGGALVDMYGFKVKSEDLTGRSPTGTPFSAGKIMSTIDANEAGELQTSGSSINGPIWNYVTLGPRGYILKERSIQSMQFVGRDAGTFAFNVEITDEGLYGKYTFVKVGEDALFMLGQRELYVYGGGTDLRPIAKQFTRELYADINRARADEIIMFHKETRDEIWILYYDANDVQKRFIYNFVENSCTFDLWPASDGDTTAVGNVIWRNDVAWLDMLLPWNVTPGSWVFYEGTGEKILLTIDATTGRVPDVPLLLDQGFVYNHSGAAYTASAETVDFDFKDPELWKYVDTVALSLQIVQKLNPRPFRMFVQVACRDNLDSDLRYSDPVSVEVSGNGNPVTKVNIRKSGRYARVKFYSDQKDIQWRISSYRILGRQGGTY